MIEHPAAPESSGKTVAIIQARISSTRLPGKVLMDIAGETMLARVVRRVQRARRVDQVVVATSAEAADEAVVGECARLGIPAYRGSVEDVLDRYYMAAACFHAGVIVRVTSDCPLIDPEIIDQVIIEYDAGEVDYVSNTLVRTYPRGLDTEVFSRRTLAKAWAEARKPYYRAHVTPYIYEHPELFRLKCVKHDRDLSQFRWTVDWPEDLAFVREVYSRAGSGAKLSLRDVTELLEAETALLELNRDARQKSLDEC